MARLPVVSGNSAMRVLCSDFGFRILRQKGSHITLTNDRVFVTIPLHKELAKGTLISILKKAEISKEEFMKYL